MVSNWNCTRAEPSPVLLAALKAEGITMFAPSAQVKVGDGAFDCESDPRCEAMPDSGSGPLNGS